jgi:signal transduction histidine kinase
LEFSIAPAYYQTNWFRAVCAVLVLSFVWAIYQIRVRQLRHDFALTVEARVGERVRIARELHDTLLQSFQGLLPRFQAASQLLPARPLEAKEDLDTGIKQAAEAITEGRDAVQGLRMSTVQTNDLAKAINTLGEELAADPANYCCPAFRVTVEGDSRGLHPILRDEIYRIAGESLRNAFRHANAHEVEVEIRYDHEQFRLRVRDDGKGIDRAVLAGRTPEGHFGLAGMQERAELIGGTLTVWSQAGDGTEVELRIPAGTAYTTGRRASWLAQKFAGKV